MCIYLHHHVGKQEVEVCIYVFLLASKYGVDIKGVTFFMTYAGINIWKDFLLFFLQTIPIKVIMLKVCIS